MQKQPCARPCVYAALVMIAILIIGLSGCGNNGTIPTTPTTSPRYDGQWSGATSQGTPITFTVSEDQAVTAIMVGYRFNGCSGFNVFSNLNLAIGTPPNQATASPGFGYGSGPPDGPNYTQVYGFFSSNSTATGSVAFGSYAGCGNGGGIWTATKK